MNGSREHISRHGRNKTRTPADSSSTEIWPEAKAIFGPLFVKGRESWSGLGSVKNRTPSGATVTNP